MVPIRRRSGSLVSSKVTGERLKSKREVRPWGQDGDDEQDAPNLQPRE